MKFKSDKQRKAVMSKMKERNGSSSASPYTISQIRNREREIMQRGQAQPEKFPYIVKSDSSTSFEYTKVEANRRFRFLKEIGHKNVRLIDNKKVNSKTNKIIGRVAYRDVNFPKRSQFKKGYEMDLFNTGHRPRDEKADTIKVTKFEKLSNDRIKFTGQLQSNGKSIKFTHSKVNDNSPFEANFILLEAWKRGDFN